MSVALIERLVERCIRRHGGFSHGHAVLLCPECKKFLETLFALTRVVQEADRG